MASTAGQRTKSIDSADDNDHNDVLQRVEEPTPTKSVKVVRNGPSQHLRFVEEITDEEATFRETIDTGDSLEGQETPKRKRGRPKGSKNTPKKDGQGVAPSKPLSGRKLFSTPVKRASEVNTSSPLGFKNVNRSARRKSARAIIERTLEGDGSEKEDEDELAEQILASGEDDDDNDPEEQDALDNTQSAPVTPSKRGRGRPKGSKNKQYSPELLGDLPAHELYFAQNRGVSSKSSNNNLSSLALLDHEEYFTLAREYEDPHTEEMAFLQELHERSFDQWQFELSQEFNICIYGWGSKRKLLHSFATHVYDSFLDHNSRKIVIVNGYLPNTSIRDIITTLATAVTAPAPPPKLGSQPSEMLETFFTLLKANSSTQLTLLINSIDSIPLRRAASQTLLSRLAAHPRVYLVASADHPNFPLLWDSSLRSTFNFLFHDCTTFQQYTAELDVVDEVHGLLGRSGRRVGGKEGVSFVLKSLPVKAKDLFQVLVAEQLASMDENGIGMRNGFGHDDDDDDDDDDLRDGGDGDDGEGRANDRARGGGDVGVEYRVLYQKAVEDFICPNEMTFRTLLKEFYDHQMIHSRKDAMGTELLSVPFRKEELETILEDLMS